MLKLGIPTLSEVVNKDDAGDKSPLNKSKTGKYDKISKSKLPPVLRKTSTMVKSPKRQTDTSKLVSGRKQRQVVQTVQND